MKTIDKLIESGKLEINAKIMFNLKDNVMDRQQAENFLYDLMTGVYREHINLFESIDMEIEN